MATKKISDSGARLKKSSFDAPPATPKIAKSPVISSVPPKSSVPKLNTGSIPSDASNRIGPGQTSKLGLNDGPAGGKPVSHSHIDKYSDGVKQMQLKMQAAGIDPGPIDGLKGPLTRAAMQKFETQFGKTAAEGFGVDPSWAELAGDTRARREATEAGDSADRPGTAAAAPAGDEARPNVGPNGLATFQGKKMTQGTAADLARMDAAARRDGVALTVNSGYRDPAYQAQLFKRAVAKYGSVAAARKWVAPPGRSQHQTGKAVDISMGGGGGKVHEWLRRNAAKFGFTQSYSWEPWHWFHRAS